MGKLTNKVAVITGAASGIGKKLTEEFVAAGATVIAGDINEEACKKLEQTFERVTSVKLDVANERDWERVVEEIRLSHYKIDVLINNAGVTSEKTIDEMTYADWELQLKVNGYGTMLGLKHIGPIMKEQADGSIVNVSSFTAKIGMGLNAYTASKGSVRAISKAASVEYGRFGVRVNTVFPGVIATPMTEGLESSEESLAHINALTPLGRIGQPEEVARAIVFLASDDASYITGAELTIDGGYSAM